MPLYEYICNRCQDEFELLVRGQERPACPQCGSQSLRQQLSVVAVHSGSSRDAAAPCPTPSSGGCGLPQCGMGGCGMQ
ncbi:MAG: zinc ribbon domain-containing protein [Pirellulaceae bacterium]